MTRAEACLKLHEVALKEVGVHETYGPEATARIIEYDTHTTLKATSDEIAWCSASANAICDWAGFPGAHSAAARSFLTYGVALDTPILGCVVVFDRHDENNPEAAHVAFCDHPDISNEIIRVLGGNQHDSFCVGRFPTSKVLGYRSPI
jgi:uncharacterized protein (TIGR02594 family)